MGYLGREVAEEPQWLPPVGQRGNPLYGPGHGKEVPDEEGAPQGEVEAAPRYGAFTSPKGKGREVTHLILECALLAAAKASWIMQYKDHSTASMVA